MSEVNKTALETFKTGYLNGETKEWPEYWRIFADNAFSELTILERQIEKLRSTLEFYANIKNYRCNPVDDDSPVFQDDGQRARDALYPNSLGAK